MLYTIFVYWKSDHSHMGGGGGGGIQTSSCGVKYNNALNKKNTDSTVTFDVQQKASYRETYSMWPIKP